MSGFRRALINSINRHVSQRNQQRAPITQAQLTFVFPLTAGRFITDIAVGGIVPPGSGVFGPNLPGTVVSSGGFTAHWLNPTNAIVEDGVLSSLAVPPQTTYDYLLATGFGFNIPSDRTILGIKAEVKCYTDNAFNLVVRAFPVKAGVIDTDITHADTQTETTSLDWVTFGGQSFLFGNTWTPADINDSGFGIAFQPGLQSGNAFVDSIRITIYTSTQSGGTGVSLFDSNITLVTASGTGETSVYSKSIPGGTFGAGQGLRVVMYFIHTDASNTTTSTVRAKFGGVTIGTVAPSFVSVVGTAMHGFVELFLFNQNGATNAQTNFFYGQSGPAAQANAAGFQSQQLGTSVVDSSVAKTLALTVQGNAASFVFNCYAVFVELIK